MKATIRRLRVGVVPDAAVEELSIGCESVRAVVAARLASMHTRHDVPPFFIRGEWGTGKSHCLALIRRMASASGFAASSVQLNARGSTLNHPQRLYPTIAGNLQNDERGRGVRSLVPSWLEDSSARAGVARFASTPEAGDLGPWLRFLVSLHSKPQRPLGHEDEWVWTTLLGGDLCWSDHSYKRSQALARLKSLALMLRHAGLRGLVVTFDEAETIDQLWNVASRLGAYHVLGCLRAIPWLWCIFGVTERFSKTIESDLADHVIHQEGLSPQAVSFLRSWSNEEFEVMKSPEIDSEKALQLTQTLTAMYARAYSLPPLAKGFFEKCVATWARNPARNPRRLIRLVVQELDTARDSLRRGGLGRPCPR